MTILLCRTTDTENSSSPRRRHSGSDSESVPEAPLPLYSEGRGELFRSPSPAVLGGRGVGVRGREATEKCTPHPQPLSPEYRGEGSFLEAPLPRVQGRGELFRSPSPLSTGELSEQTLNRNKETPCVTHHCNTTNRMGAASARRPACRTQESTSLMPLSLLCVADYQKDLRGYTDNTAYA